MAVEQVLQRQSVEVITFAFTGTEQSEYRAETSEQCENNHIQSIGSIKGARRDGEEDEWVSCWLL